MGSANAFSNSFLLSRITWSGRRTIGSDPFHRSAVALRRRRRFVSFGAVTDVAAIAIGLVSSACMLTGGNNATPAAATSDAGMAQRNPFSRYRCGTSFCNPSAAKIENAGYAGRRYVTLGCRQSRTRRTSRRTKLGVASTFGRACEPSSTTLRSRTEATANTIASASTHTQKRPYSGGLTRRRHHSLCLSENSIGPARRIRHIGCIDASTTSR